MMRVLDLFSGIGGFSLGLERTGGFRTVAFCEIDPFCRRVLAKHWPEVPALGDVAQAEFPDADVVCGGFPCQDVSRAGKRAGLSGARSGLYRELVRAIRLVRPRYAIVENVAELLADGMGTVLGDVAQSGLDAEWDCVPAGFIGAPHWRDRVWIIAHAVGARLEGWRPAEAARTTQRELAGRAFRVGTSWADAPEIPRVGYGLPDWVDRIRSIGNAVVPQIPELIGRAIIAAEAARQQVAA
jgi:DNA (cytosine-5)-methyltransferase 1